MKDFANASFSPDTVALLQSAMEATVAQVQEALQKHPAAYPELVVTSSEKGDGIETLRAIIATME